MDGAYVERTVAQAEGVTDSQDTRPSEYPR